MIIKAINTNIVTGQDRSIFDLLDEYLPELSEKSIVAITSKVVSICEGRIRKIDTISKQELIKQEADLYLSPAYSKYGYSFTITNNTLIPMSGIDESNGDGYYILWPKDVQKTANKIRTYLSDKHSINELGIIITDSTCMPLRRGTTGICLAHSGFRALNDYTHTKDIFGRKFALTQSSISGGLAASAVLAMGEGSERTPFALISGLDSVQFQSRDPSPAELNELSVSKEEDLFAPFLEKADWQR